VSVHDYDDDDDERYDDETKSSEAMNSEPFAFVASEGLYVLYMDTSDYTITQFCTSQSVRP
jgi:hypothetical protein